MPGGTVLPRYAAEFLQLFGFIVNALPPTISAGPGRHLPILAARGVDLARLLAIILDNARADFIGLNGVIKSAVLFWLRVRLFRNIGEQQWPPLI